MRKLQGLGANSWTWAVGLGGLMVAGLVGCGGDGPTAGAQASNDSAAGRPLPTLEIPTQSVATPPIPSRPVEIETAPASASDREPIGQAQPALRYRLDDTVDSARESVQDLRTRAESGADSLKEKADRTIDKTQKRIQTTADDLGKKVDGAIGEAERRADQLQKQASDVQKKARDVREGVEQTGKALRNLIGGEGARPK